MHTTSTSSRSSERSRRSPVGRPVALRVGAGLSVVAMLLFSACVPVHHHGHGHHQGPPPDGLETCMLATCFGATLLGASPREAAVAAAAAGLIYLETHDDHWHDPYCGCPSRWYDGYRVYWYSGRWEFHDGQHWCEVRPRGPGW